MSAEPYPKSVTLALRAMVAVIALTFIEILLELIDWQWTDLLVDSLFVGMFLAVFLGYGALVYFVSRRRRWANFTTMALSAISLLAAPFLLWTSPPMDGYEWVIFTSYAILDVTILSQLLSHNAREWFALPHQVQGVF
jgi:hypothetical protein